MCAAILHDTVDDTPYTLAALSREFGAEIGAIVAGLVALDSIRGRLDSIRGRRGSKAARAMAALGAADTRVVTMKLADRLHNMQTVQFLPKASQLRKAREVRDIFVPVAEQLSIVTVSTELETLASATLTRYQVAGHPPWRAPRPPVPRRRAIVALDIESSTSRPDQVKAELRKTLYELFDGALRAAGIQPRHRDRFADRGDGFLALIHSADQAPEMLMKRVIPALGLLLTEYNASRLSPLRIRVVIHAGKVFYDANGCFGEAVDTAFRLLDAAQVKQALQDTQASHVLIVSDEIYRAAGAAPSTFNRQVSVQVGVGKHQGWIGR